MSLNFCCVTATMSTQTHQTNNYLKHTQKLILHIHTVKSINRNVQYTHTHTHTHIISVGSNALQK